MTLTTTQVAEKLGVSNAVVKGFVKRGELKSINYDATKKTKQFLKFNSKDVNEFIVAKKANGGIKKKNRARGPHAQPATGVMTTLREIKAEMSALREEMKELRRLWA